MMLNQWTIEDVDFDAIADSAYDISIFACGYEERSRYLFSQLEPKSSSVLVFGFKSSVGDSVYDSNYKFYTNESNAYFVEVDYNDTSEISSRVLLELNRVLSEKVEEEIRVLVDYSSMPRIWFSELLCIFKYFDISGKMSVDFSYSCGQHSEYSDSASQLGQPFTLPGCESVASNNKRTVAIFGLGFDSSAPECIFDKIEPQRSFGVIAKPGSIDMYDQEAEKINKFFIDNNLDSVFYCPIDSVRRTYFSLRESCYPYLSNSTVVIVPFGPKTHALASMILAMEYQEVTCLYASTGSRSNPVVATGRLVVTRILID